MVVVTRVITFKDSAPITEVMAYRRVLSALEGFRGSGNVGSHETKLNVGCCALKQACGGEGWAAGVEGPCILEARQG